MSENLVLDAFRALSERAPDRPLLAFAGDDGAEEATLTPGELRDRADTVAARLARDRLAPGDRVLLAYPPGLEFVVGLLGAMSAGLIPVPVPPPNPAAPGADLTAFAAAAASSGARLVLTSRAYARARAVAQARDTVVGLLRKGRPQWPDLPWLATDSLGTGGRAPSRPTPSPGDVALLQYTSGSTSAPKGVCITYGNLAHQLACNARELGLDAGSHAVLWLPHFHDFGLVSGILSALHGNGRLTMFSPLAFVRRPELWPELLSRGRATHTAAPNFAYELVVRKTTPAQRARWDLSALRVAMSAAEPIREPVVRAFCEAFAASGMRADAFCPAYGLAEHTVGVSVRGRGRVRASARALEAGDVADGPDARVLVGCGRPSAGVVVRVVDPQTGEVLPEDRVGEIWVDSPSKAAGYFGLEDASRETFRARTADPSDDREYLRTGDLGFLHEGELYVTGRLKDLVIVRGRNVYPQDLETSARDAHPEIRPGGVAAFSTDGDVDERLVVLVEARDKKTSPATADAIAAAVRRRLAETHQLACDTVVVLAPGSLLKTTSGKIRRRACRQAWLDRALPGVLRVVDATAADVATIEAVPEATPEPEAAPSSAVGEAAQPHPGPERPDTRFEGIEPSYRAMIAQAARFLAASAARGSEKRPSGVAARGVLRVAAGPDVPAHGFFAAGRELPVLLRHDNRTAADDAAPDARVASLRVLDPASPDDLDRSALDLVLLTGRCFFHRTAEDFFRFSVASPEQREALLRVSPHRGRAAWETMRTGTSYRAFHYHTQTASRFQAADGRAFFARYRLRAPDRPEDGGFVEPDAPFPPTAPSRRPDDTRSPSCLRDAFRADVAREAVEYVLEVQLRPAQGDADDVLDATRPWPEDVAPWRELARVRLDRVVDGPLDDLAFSPANAPDDLGVVPARHERESASIDHVRTILYEVASASRRGRPLSPALRALLDPRPVEPVAPARPRVAVVGAGASGLTVARELERRGFAVTVLERDGEVAGMCRTRRLDGVTCDLGGHMIFRDVYPTIVGLANELGQPLVADFPDCTISLETGRPMPKVATAATALARARVGRLLQDAGATRTGLAGIDASLALTIEEWLARDDLAALWDWMGTIFVAAGYGHLEDRIPALYLAKSFTHTQDEGGRFQLRDGFQALWERVAAGLADVRTGTEVVAAARDEAGVTLTLRGPGGPSTERFDQLVVAHSPSAALGWLDADPEERDLFGRVRHLRYVSAFAEVEGLPDDLRGRWCFVAENARDAARRGHVLSFVQPDPAKPIVGLVAYEPADGADPVALYAEDFARLGARLTRMRLRQSWAYFPHFGVEDVRAGALAQAEALQGRRRTWHASTLLSHELTECAAAYARTVAERMDRARGRSEPAPAPVAADDGASPFAHVRAAMEVEATRVVAWLQRALAAELGLAGLPDADAPLTVLGVDSLRAASLHQRIAAESGLALPDTLLADAGSLRSLARRLVGEIASPSPVAATSADDDTLDLLRSLEDA